MKDIIFYFYGYVVFFYSLGLMVSYVILMWLAELGILRSKHSHLSVYPKYIMDNSPYTPGVSIIAPAYNEEKTIVNNVNSLLAQEYPIFEVVIVNDGSRDKTLELLIEHFSLVEVPFAYVEYIHTKPYRRLFKLRELGRLRPSARNAAAQQYAAQALEGMGMEVTGARVRMVSDDQADVAIELVYDGAQRTVEVTV